MRKIVRMLCVVCASSTDRIHLIWFSDPFNREKRVTSSLSSLSLKDLGLKLVLTGSGSSWSGRWRMESLSDCGSLLSASVSSPVVGEWGQLLIHHLTFSFLCHIP